MAITRRKLLKTMSAAGAALALPGATWARAASPASVVEASNAKPDPSGRKPGERRKPNLVFIMADQLGASFVGCYGSGVESTPTLDHLARAGARFERNYAVCPVCSPNRASIFTGRSPEIHGIIAANYRLATDGPLFTHVLKSEGYRTGGFGKFHFTEMPLHPYVDLQPYGFDESVMTEDPKFGHWLDWIEREHPEYYGQALSLCWPQPYYKAYGRDRRDLEPAFNAAYKQYLEPLKKASPWPAMFVSPLPSELQQTTYITDCSLDFLRRHHEQHEDDPFFCYISYVAPHDPYDPPKPYDTMFNPADMQPVIPRAVERYEAPILEWSRDFFYNIREYSDRPEIMNQLRAYYHGNIRLIDDQIARVVQYLEKTGQMENTIFVFTTDHGDMMGDHGFLAKGCMHYDGAIRTPMIVSGRGVQSGVVSSRLTSSLDLFPTICDWVGTDPRPPLEGKSFAGACRGEATDKGWPAVTVQFNQAHSVITDDQWRMTLFQGAGLGQMFNLNEDPQEQRDLYHVADANTRHMELLERHARAYMESHQLHHYRNLPVSEGHHCLVQGNFELTPCPW